MHGSERLPFEGAHLMERQHFHPFNIRHGSDELRDFLNVSGIIGQSGNQHEAHPHGLPHRVQPFGEAQRGREFDTRYLPVGVGISALDVEQHQIDALEIFVAGAVTEKARGIEGGMQTHCLRGREHSLSETELYERLTTGYRQAAPHGTQPRCEIAQAPDRVFEFDPGPVLQLPGVRIVTVLAPQIAPGHEKHDTHAWAVHRRSGLVGVHPAMGLLLPLEALGLRGIGRPAGPEVEPAADIHHPVFRHVRLTPLSSCGGRYSRSWDR